jgi:uncharacterized protein (DUF2141 family)
MMSRFVWLVAVVAGALSVQVNAADLKIHLVGLRNIQGSLRLSLYNSAETFLQTEERLANVKIARIWSNPVSVCFAGLPPGTYAVTVHHDENNDGHINRNLLGIPREGYGFSNDARGAMGPPSFAKAAVTLAQTDQVITITLRY